MTRSNSLVSVALLSAALLLAVATPAWSSDSDNPTVEYRMNLMESLAKHSKASWMIARGQVARPGDLVAHATAMHDASKIFGELFPADTGPDKVKTEAKPEVWKNADKFAAANKAFEAETAKLVEAAKKGDLDAYRAQLKAVGGQCGDCHDAFRVED